MNKKLALGYGLICYLISLGVFLYMISFIGNFIVPKSIASGSSGAFWPSLIVNVLLLSLFALQHSVMARASFKKWWTKIVPRPIERSTYVLLASLTLVFIFWQWRPLPAVIWNIEMEWVRWLLWGFFGLGWVIVLVSAHQINGDHLFGRQQVRQYLHGKKLSSPKFQTPGLYRHTRHPLMLGFLIAFWSTPQMTVGHLLFSLVMTGYILIGLHFEERALVQRFGQRYRQYRQQVPMLIPRLSAAAKQQRSTESGTALD